MATLLEQIQSDEPLAGGKQRGHWKASIESYTQISAAIHRVSTEYYYELFVYGKVVEKSIPPEHPLRLSWTHFIELIRIDDPLKRAFYEVECLHGNWSIRQLQRQI